jgi:hypothetical protein
MLHFILCNLLYIVYALVHCLQYTVNSAFTIPLLYCIVNSVCFISLCAMCCKQCILFF